jgi:hypothetical protein
MITTALTFNNVDFNPVVEDKQIWLTASDLATALGYKNTKSITNLYNARSDEFSASMTLVIDSVTKGFGSGNSKKPVRVFSLRGCHLLAMFARTKVAKDFRKWVLDVLDNEVGAPVIEHEELPSSVKDRNGLIKTVHMTMKRLDLGFSEAFNLVLHRFNVAHVGDLTQSQVGEATEYLHRLMFTGHNASAPAQGVEPPYHYRNNERLVSQADAQGNLWTRPLADHEFVISTTSLPQFINDCDDFDLQELTALSFSVSKKMVEAQSWSNVVMVGRDGEQS